MQRSTTLTTFFVRSCGALLLAALLVAPRAYAVDSKTEANQLVQEATKVAHQMTSDPKLKQTMAKAKGVFIVPDFGRGALGVGGRGGQGVMLTHKGDKWSDPAFFNMGGISLGPQAGVTAGSIAFLLMSDKAVNSFKGGNNFSLNAGAGFTIVNYSADAQASLGKSDVVMWADTEGAYAGATVGVTDITSDDEENAAFYNRKTDTQKIIMGQAPENPAAKPLKQALPS